MVYTYHFVFLHFVAIMHGLVSLGSELQSQSRRSESHMFGRRFACIASGVVRSNDLIRVPNHIPCSNPIGLPIADGALEGWRLQDHARLNCPPPTYTKPKRVSNISSHCRMQSARPGCEGVRRLWRRTCSGGWGFGGAGSGGARSWPCARRKEPPDWRGWGAGRGGGRSWHCARRKGPTGIAPLAASRRLAPLAASPDAAACLAACRSARGCCCLSDGLSL